MTGQRYARVAGAGSALPGRVVPNLYFESMVETDDQWIRERTGIHNRRFAEDGDTTSTLAASATKRALEAAQISPESVDLLIVATTTPDRPIPATAAFVQAHLGMSCPGFDLNAACAGFVYGLSVGSAQIQAGAAERVVVVGSEVLSRHLNMADRTTCVLFGDGAGAVVLVPGDEPGVIDSRLALDGRHARNITQPAGGTEEPATEEAVQAARTKIRMEDGATVFREAVVGMATASGELLQKAGVSPDQVDWVIAHQANARILASVGRRLGVDPEKVVIDIADVGNTSAASIPIALDRAWRSGKVQPGHLILTTAFGGGFAWGANLLRWTAPAPAAETSSAPEGSNG
jgi:3-oxoacyl-[acyl-carrier-protein] synthase-3